MSNKQKTAIQQLMTELNELYPNLLNVYTAGGREFVNTCHKYLAVEKEQIIMAYHNGYSDAIQAEPKQYEPQQYYEQTFGGNK